MANNKKGLVLLLCTALMCTNFWGCRRENHSSSQQITKEPITLNILTYGSSSQEACKRISNALSTVTLDRFGFAVNLEQASLSDYTSILSREQMLGNAPDLFSYGEQNDLTGYIMKNEVMRLNDLLNDEGGSILNQVGKDSWNTVTLFNSIYAVPSVNGSSYSLGFMARKDIVDALGVNSADIQDWDSLHELLLCVKKKYPDMKPVVSHFGQTIQTLGEDPLGNDIGVLLDGKQRTVENLFSSDMYYKICKRMHQWYNEDLILKNAYSYNESYSTLFKACNGFGFFVRLNEYAGTSADRATGTSMVAFQLSNSIRNTSNYNTGWCISSSTPHAKLAMQLLNLLYKDNDIEDLCIYGQEGKDYIRLDAHTVTSPEKSDVNTWNTIAWAWPNRAIASNWQQGSSNGAPEKSPENITVSNAMGFVFDSSPCQTAVDQCQSVVDKYNNALLCGALDPDEAIPLFLQELKSAGLDTVITYKQYQLNAWFANKSG